MNKSLWIVLAIVATATLASALAVVSLTRTPTNPSQVSTTSSVGVISQLTAGRAVNHQVSDKYGNSGVSFPLYQTIPVTIYASSPTSTSLAALSVPSDAWVYLGTNNVTATP